MSVDHTWSHRMWTLANINIYDTGCLYVVTTFCRCQLADTGSSLTVRALAKRRISPNGVKLTSRGDDRDERGVLQVVMIIVDRVAKMFRVTCSDIGRCSRMI